MGTDRLYIVSCVPARLASGATYAASGGSRWICRESLALDLAAEGITVNAVTLLDHPTTPSNQLNRRGTISNVLLMLRAIPVDASARPMKWPQRLPFSPRMVRVL